MILYGLVLSPGELAGYGVIATALGAAVGHVSRAWVQGRRVAARVDAAAAQAAAAQAEAEGRESTAQHKLAAEEAARTDSIAVDMAHAEREERIAAQGREHRCLEVVAELRVELAECRKDHERRELFEKWVRDNMPRAPGTAPPPAPAPPRKPTPADGTPRVNKE